MGYPLCDLFNISPLEISRRREFMCITSVKDEIIKGIHKVIDEEIKDIVDNFYVYLSKFH